MIQCRSLSDCLVGVDRVVYAHLCKGDLMNNKKIGTAFERKMCDILAKDGYWVHFISPDNRGAQPFDIIAVKNGIAIVADCKTCDSNIFRMSRLEDNQRLAFEKWRACGNSEPLVFIEHDKKVFCVEYHELELYDRIHLNNWRPWCILE